MFWLLNEDLNIAWRGSFEVDQFLDEIAVSTGAGSFELMLRFLSGIRFDLLFQFVSHLQKGDRDI